MPKKILITIIFISVFLVSLSLVYAAGGGGGGGGGGADVCTSDRWDCTQWTECSAQSQQTRSCKLLADCPNTQDPVPLESRSCAPACNLVSWNCVEWSACTLSGSQTRTCSLPACEGTPPAKPAEAQSCTSPKTQSKPLVQPQPKTQAQPKATPAVAACRAQDESKCGAWGVCEEDGKQRRTCPTQGCAQERACPGLKCSHLPTIEERVECRVKLTPTETHAEQKILYAPEYCRIEEAAEEKSECINLYWSLERCWAMPAGPERQACGREVTGMGTFDAEKKECVKKKGLERRACNEELKDKTEEWTLFEMYELEFLAEELLKKNKVKLGDVVALDVFVEKQKAKLDQEDTIRGWKKILQETKAYWNNFIKTQVKQ